MSDIAIPIVFPDYLIAVNTPKTKVKIPDFLPGIDLFPESVTLPETKSKFPELGHAGILFIKGATGLTKYYEYGRYDSAGKGLVRKLTIRDVVMAGGSPTKQSLSYTLSQISVKSGQGGRISGAYIPVKDKFDAMQAYVNKRVLDNRNSSRKPYELMSNSCNHFMKGVLDAAGLNLPYMFDPRPNSYIEEIRDDFSDLDYSKVENKLVVEDAPQSLANHLQALFQTAAV